MAEYGKIVDLRNVMEFVAWINLGGVAAILGFRVAGL